MAHQPNRKENLSRTEHNRAKVLVRHRICFPLNFHVWISWSEKVFVSLEAIIFTPKTSPRELTCWAPLLARTLSMFSLHSTTTPNNSSFPGFLLLLSWKVDFWLLWNKMFSFKFLYSSLNIFYRIPKQMGFYKSLKEEGGGGGLKVEKNPQNFFVLSEWPNGRPVQSVA